MEERDQFQAETLSTIILFEVWLLSVSICCDLIYFMRVDKNNCAYTFQTIQFPVPS